MKSTLLLLNFLLLSLSILFAQDGALDLTFNSTGKVTTPIGLANDEGRSIAIQPDGKIVVAGFSYAGNKSNFAVVRYNTDGSLDNTFGSGGKVTTVIGLSTDQAMSVTIQSDGKIVVAGASSPSDGIHFDIAVVRYTTSGALDVTFNPSGTVPGIEQRQ
jgi:uncharacterized delta-60 repeat protein